MSDTTHDQSRGTEPSGLRKSALAGYRWLLLVFLLQSLLVGLADNAALYGGLHALDGILVLAIAGFLYTMSRRRA